MANLVFTCDVTSVYIDYGIYAGVNGITTSKGAYDKDSILEIELASDSSYVSIKKSNGAFMYLTYTTASGFNMKVDSVAGTTPTSNQHLFDLLTACKQQEFRYNNITSATTTSVKSGMGTLRKIIFNKTVALGTVTIYDNTAASGNKIGTITFPAALLASQDYLDFDVAFSTGLTIVTTGTMDITIVYK